MRNEKILISKPVLYTGRVLKAIVCLFLLFDATMKIIRESHVLKNCAELGLPQNSIQPLGIYLFIATIFYANPRTSIAGATLITAYLGGATAITFISKLEGHPFLFSVVFGIIVWIAEYLQSQKLKSILPIIK